MSIIVGQTNTDLAAGRGIFKCIRKYIHNHLVKVLTVYPYGNRRCIVIEKQLKLLTLCLTLKEGVDILYEGNKVGLTHMHLHLAFVNLPKVHHLIDQT